MVVGLGEALWDLMPAGRHIGGAPLNFAYISSLLGERAVIVSRIGEDQAGEELLRELATHGVDAAYIQRDKILPTGTVQVEVSTDGQPAYEIRQPSAWDALKWSPQWKELAQQADAVCFGTLAQRSEQSRKTIQTFLQATHSDCIRILDANLRAPFFSAELIADSIRMATIVKMNEEEFSQISAMMGVSAPDLRQGSQIFAKSFNLELVCVTRGSRGSVLATPERILEHPGFRIAVVDTVGAGDAFTAAITRCRLSHLGLEATISAANRWAAWVASQAGAMPVMEEALRRRMLP